MLLDIIILPPKDLREKIGKAITQSTKGLGISYIVDNKKFIPHLSLFHLKTSKAGLKKIERFLTVLASTQDPFLIKDGVFKSPSETSLSYRFKLNPILLQLQVKVRSYCAPLRTSVLPIRPRRLLTPLEKKLRREFGTQYLFERTTPHFTMAKLLSSSDNIKLLEKMKPKKITFTAKKLAVAQVDLDGQVTKILKTFKLK